MYGRELLLLVLCRLTPVAGLMFLSHICQALHFVPLLRWFAAGHRLGQSAEGTAG